VISRLLRIASGFASEDQSWLRSNAEFRALVEYQRELADRHDSVFSIITFDLKLAPSRNRTAEPRLLDVLHSRLRATDAIGRIDHRFIAVLLPHTSHVGAEVVVRDLVLNSTDAVRRDMASVSTFPDDWTDAGEDWRPPSDPVRKLIYKDRPLWKRGLDTLGALFALVLLSPIMLLTALAVRATSRGPVLYRQKRAGLGGMPFDFYKFRTMSEDADARKLALMCRNERKGPVFKIKDDPRITPVGRILRRWSIDELPQLFNVFTGDMSLVGPRPIPMAEVERHSRWHRRRLDAMPGITGLWQVEARDDPDYDNWVRLDVAYLRRRCLLLDLRILLRTIPAVVSGRGAS
jgi:lipopolysaccharide/colanic/teichoic acid biosynthesis glycosyltransferase